MSPTGHFPGDGILTQLATSLPNERLVGVMDARAREIERTWAIIGARDRLLRFTAFPGRSQKV